MTDIDQISFDPRETSAYIDNVRRPRRRLKVVSAICGTAALAAAVAIPLLTWNPTCAPGVHAVEVTAGEESVRECVGVTADFPFDPRYEAAVRAMVEENKEAVKGGPGTYVTVALMSPMSSSDPRFVHQLEGAVAGQRRANRESLIGDTPKIRLVLANTGSRSDQWRQVVDRLTDMVQEPDRLRAVLGVGLSLGSTQQAAAELNKRASLLMIGTILTADEFDKRLVPGLARVNTSVGDQIEALGRYLQDEHGAKKAIIVHYENDDDLYASAQHKAFKRQRNMLAYWENGGKVEYPFGSDPGNQFRRISDNICFNKPDLVMYAGRASDLPKFIEYLGTRPCENDKITVVTGSDAVRLLLKTPENAGAREVLSRNSTVELLYSPLAEPSLLRDPSRNQNAAGYTAFEKTVSGLGFDRANLDTGWGIMAHDAMLAAAKAIRESAVGGIASPASVRDMIYLFSTPNSAVPGASGHIMFDSNGNRVVRELPVLRFRADGPPEYLGTHPVPAAR